MPHFFRKYTIIQKLLSHVKFQWKWDIWLNVTSLVKNGPIWFKVTHFGCNWNFLVKMAHFDLKWHILVEIDISWLKWHLSIEEDIIRQKEHDVDIVIFSTFARILYLKIIIKGFFFSKIAIFSDHSSFFWIYNIFYKKQYKFDEKLSKPKNVSQKF